jgi:hypothetical protein
MLRRADKMAPDLPDLEVALAALGSRNSLRSSVRFPPMFAEAMDWLLAFEQLDLRTPIGVNSLAEAAAAQRYTSSPWLLWQPYDAPQRPPVEAVLEDFDELVDFHPGPFHPLAKRYVLAPGSGGAAVGDRIRELSGEAVRRISPARRRRRAVTRSTLPPAALDKAKTVIHQSAKQQKTTQRVAAQRLGVEGIARRANLPQSLASRCFRYFTT